MQFLLIAAMLVAAVTTHAQEFLNAHIDEIRSLAGTKELSIGKFQKLDELVEKAIGAIASDKDVEAVRHAAREELTRSDSSYIGFIYLTHILIVKDKDAAETFQSFAETANANPDRLRKLVTKLGIAYRTDWNASGSPIKTAGLTDKQIARILEKMFEHQSLKIGIDAIDLLTGYGWEQSNTKPVDQKLGLELLKKAVRNANRPDVFKAAMERKLHFDKKSQP